MTYQGNSFMPMNQNPTRLNVTSPILVRKGHSAIAFRKTTSVNIISVLLCGVLLLSASIPNMGLSSTKGTTNYFSGVNHGDQSDIKVTSVSLDDVDSDLSNNLSLISDELRKKFGLKVSHWAKILRVERKTLYNWDKNPNVNIQGETALRISVLNEFARSFRREHKDYFAKMLFGRLANKGLLAAFTAPKLDLDVLLEAYDSVYAQLDGFVVRSDLLS
ncbi:MULTISPECIES: hypothetical protein [Gammaproteobacteria]|uniref:hypothetical protein n=1 Tax=Gammaproteobacteria TaxID=1236 RepID=UPI000D850E47|nr:MULTISPECIES: hypothetical protein [Gammaproteobacteria]MBP6518336.1 hypothetical protein [Shewanella sp.]SPY70801.1 Uncharacterised protein [Providencia alcalifaciens]